MLFGQNRDQLRRVYFESWRKHREKLPLEPLEEMLTSVILEHPEFHALLENEDASRDKDYMPELGQTNPFLHMGMHIAIREQLATDRPAGIRDIYKQLLTRLHDTHTVEHHMAECLAEMIWQAQRNNTAPDEIVYLDRLRSLL